jgi:hypothetical protein
MQMAHGLACQCLPSFSSPFSRHDFTLPQLFACLVVKDQLKRSYRGAEALLRDSQSWLDDIGMSRAPDHNTLCRAARFLLKQLHVDRVLDVMVGWAAEADMLKLDEHPLAIDSTTFDSHHVSRHYERRCHQTRGRMKARDRKRGRKSSRSDTVRNLPKLAISLATSCHLICSLKTGTGAGADHPYFEPLVFDAWRRVPNRRFTVVGDAGFDGEPQHQIGRDDMGLITLIPPDSGRPPQPGKPPGGRWRRVMKQLLGTKRSRKRCGYTSRWQIETGNSMVKRNQGASLAGKSPASRERDMRLRVLTHNVMIL